MGERPIIFSAEMVRAILAGDKAQTRRILKQQPEQFRLADGTLAPVTLVYTRGELLPRLAIGRVIPRQPPIYHFTGQRLWVRETAHAEELPDGRDGVRYHADQAWLPIANSRAAAEDWLGLRGAVPDDEDGMPSRIGRTRSAIHMPRWASRITLTTRALFVERVQDIDRGDAMAEGCPFPNMAAGPDPRGWFRGIWTSIHGKKPGRSWEANPWVLVIEFTAEIRTTESSHGR